MRYIGIIRCDESAFVVDKDHFAGTVAGRAQQPGRIAAGDRQTLTFGVAGPLHQTGIVIGKTVCRVLCVRIGQQENTVRRRLAAVGGAGHAFVGAVVQRRIRQNSLLLRRKRRVQEIVVQPLPQVAPCIVVGIARLIRVAPVCGFAVIVRAGFEDIAVHRLAVDECLAQQNSLLRVEHAPLQRPVAEPVGRVRLIAVIILLRGALGGFHAGHPRAVLREPDAAVFLVAERDFTIPHIVRRGHAPVGIIARTGVVAVACPLGKVRRGCFQRSDGLLVGELALQIGTELDNVAVPVRHNHRIQIHRDGGTDAEIGIIRAVVVIERTGGMHAANGGGRVARRTQPPRRGSARRDAQSLTFRVIRTLRLARGVARVDVAAEAVRRVLRFFIGQQEDFVRRRRAVESRKARAVGTVVERCHRDHILLRRRERRGIEVIVQPCAQRAFCVVVRIVRLIRVAVVFAAFLQRVVVDRLAVNDRFTQHKPRCRVEHAPVQRLIAEPIDRVCRIAVVILIGVVRRSAVAGTFRTVLRALNAAVFLPVDRHVAVLHVVLRRHTAVGRAAPAAVIAVGLPAVCRRVQRVDRCVVCDARLRIAAERDDVADLAVRGACRHAQSGKARHREHERKQNAKCSFHTEHPFRLPISIIPYLLFIFYFRTTHFYGKSIVRTDAHRMPRTGSIYVFA